MVKIAPCLGATWGSNSFYSDTLGGKVPAPSRLGCGGCAVVGGRERLPYFYCRELEGVTMPGFEKIYRQG
jgi:hypothetical protein